MIGLNNALWAALGSLALMLASLVWVFGGLPHRPPHH